MKLYVNCKCGRNKMLIKKYTELGYEIIILNVQIDRRAEAKSYGKRLPFIVNGEATEL